MNIKVTIDGKEYPIEPATFRRLLSTARFSLENLERQEGAALPRADRNALKWIYKIQARHTGLI